MVDMDFLQLLNEFCGEFIDSKTLSSVAALYALGTGGKRKRFLFSLNAAYCFDKQICDNAKRLALAVELIHNYSLIHDDLPCMDNSLVRRGQASCFAKFGAGQATLAGDALLNLAAQVLFGGDNLSQYLAACKYLFDCSGFDGMIKGQSIDISANAINLKEYKNLAKEKTSKLFCAAVVPQVILSNARQQEIELWERFCECYGMAFQFADDIADSKTDVDSPNILKYLSLNEAKAEIKELCKQAVDCLVKTNKQCGFFIDAANELCNLL